jgi:hypothetical protein
VAVCVVGDGEAVPFGDDGAVVRGRRQWDSLRGLWWCLVRRRR